MKEENKCTCNMKGAESDIGHFAGCPALSSKHSLLLERVGKIKIRYEGNRKSDDWPEKYQGEIAYNQAVHDITKIINEVFNEK